MTTVGLIGSGHVGTAVARLAIAAGYDVVLSNSRGPDTLAGHVAQLGTHARAATLTEAAEAGDFVVLGLPFRAYRQVPVEPLAGKLVVDAMNYYPFRDRRIRELDDESTTTSELLQAHLSESRVVKALNNIFSVHLALLRRSRGHPGRSALAIAGDDANAKTSVRRFLDLIGYDAVDVGPLSEGWRFERGTPAFLEPYDLPSAFALTPVPRPATRADLLIALRRAVRYTEP